MGKRRFVLAALVFCLALAFSSEPMAQQEEAGVSPGAPTAVTAPAALKEAAGTGEPAAEESAGTEWLWGEVVAVDATERQLEIRHLNYETYEEVTTILKVDDRTMFENAADLGGIGAGDHVTMDYRIVGGSRIAELVVLEKEEAETAE